VVAGAGRVAVVINAGRPVSIGHVDRRYPGSAGSPWTSLDGDWSGVYASGNINAYLDTYRDWCDCAPMIRNGAQMIVRGWSIWRSVARGWRSSRQNPGSPGPGRAIDIHRETQTATTI
jgi:hypothetical protein